MDFLVAALQMSSTCISTQLTNAATYSNVFMYERLQSFKVHILREAFGTFGTNVNDPIGII